MLGYKSRVIVGSRLLVCSVWEAQDWDRVSNWAYLFNLDLVPHESGREERQGSRYSGGGCGRLPEHGQEQHHQQPETHARVHRGLHSRRHQVGSRLFPPFHTLSLISVPLCCLCLLRLIISNWAACLVARVQGAAASAARPPRQARRLARHCGRPELRPRCCCASKLSPRTHCFVFTSSYWSIHARMSYISWAVCCCFLGRVDSRSEWVCGSDHAESRPWEGIFSWSSLRCISTVLQYVRVAFYALNVRYNVHVSYFIFAC